jgi:hypothetical protein
MNAIEKMNAERIARAQRCIVNAIEKMNAERIARAQRCIDIYEGGGTSDDDSTAVSDLLADLMHWCGTDNDVVFDVRLRMARTNYNAEMDEARGKWKPEIDPLDEGDNLGESPDY